MLTDVLGTESRSEKIAIVRDLKKYQELVADDKWDTKDGLELKKKLDNWGAGYEPELIRLDMDVRLKEMDRRS